MLTAVIALWAACGQAQKAVHPDAAIDTVRLFNPQPDDANDRYSQDVFRNSAVLIQWRYGITVAGRQQRVKDVVQIKDSIIKYADSLRPHRFFIITDSATAFSEIMTVIAQLQALKIDNYRVMKARGFFKPEAPVVPYTPPTITVTTRPASPDDLSIAVLPESYNFSRNGTETAFSDTSQIAALLENPRQFTPGNRIIIYTYENTQYARVEGLIKVLNDHKIYTFNLLTRH